MMIVAAQQGNYQPTFSPPSPFSSLRQCLNDPPPVVPVDTCVLGGACCMQSAKLSKVTYVHGPARGLRLCKTVAESHRLESLDLFHNFQNHFWKNKKCVACSFFFHDHNNKQQATQNNTRQCNTNNLCADCMKHKKA